MDGGVKSNSWLIIFVSIFQVNDFGWMFFIKMKINLIETILFECIYRRWQKALKKRSKEREFYSKQ